MLLVRWAFPVQPTTASPFCPCYWCLISRINLGSLVHRRAVIVSERKKAHPAVSLHADAPGRRCLIRWRAGRESPSNFPQALTNLQEGKRGKAWTWRVCCGNEEKGVAAYRSGKMRRETCTSFGPCGQKGRRVRALRFASAEFRTRPRPRTKPTDGMDVPAVRYLVYFFYRRVGYDFAYLLLALILLPYRKKM